MTSQAHAHQPQI